MPKSIGELLKELPEDARMDAYYYGFDRTGVGAVDNILSQVAIAGKGAHHTENWSDQLDFQYYGSRKPFEERIQDAAHEAAELVNGLCEMVSADALKKNKAKQALYILLADLRQHEILEGESVECRGTRDVWFDVSDSLNEIIDLL